MTLVEFTNDQCPYCRRDNLMTKPRLVKDYVETGKLKYVLREFPLASIHPRATKAAEAARSPTPPSSGPSTNWSLRPRRAPDPSLPQGTGIGTHANDGRY